MRLALTEEQRATLAYWVPALAAGLVTWLVVLLVGQTPLIRASALALVVVGMALMLRRWGAPLAFLGGLAFAFSPAFWSQTGGSPDRVSLPVILGGLALAGVGAVLAARATRRPALSLILGLFIFALLFLGVLAEPRSLRLTTLLAAWTLYLLVDGLLLANPRPDEAPPESLRLRHTLGILLLLVAGVANDPLFTLLVPAVSLGWFLSASPVPRRYWLVLLILLGIGVRGIVLQYVDDGWWLYPATRAEASGLRMPFLLADGWRAASRWIYLFGLMIEQFTPVGLVLSVVGLSRLARWYPTLGVVMMVAYATYFVFGLVYFGRDSAVLLLPLLMIQTLWITYAVYSLGQWLQRGASPVSYVARWLAPAAFILLPLFLLLRIAGVI